MMNNRFFLVSTILIATVFAKWEGISSTSPVPAKMDLLNSNISTSTIQFTLDGFNLIAASTDKGDAFIAKIEGGASIMELGSPDLHQLATSVIIPDDKYMEIRVLSSQYTEYKNILIAPSKGNLSREVNPSEVSYQWSNIYERDEFFPGKLTELRDPYILRDNRGQTIVAYPFQYNPKSKTLRVYTELVVEVFENGNSNINVKHRQLQRSGTKKMNHEFNKIYENRFLNSRNDSRFEYLLDEGNMLIISNSDFMDEMEPFIEWKNRKGIHTEIVNVSTIGVNSNAISSYVEDYYNTNGLTYLLLVGDIAQIPSPSVGGSASDPTYGFIEGNDSYAEVIVGRFSGQNPSQIQTQVQRSIEYEHDPQENADWYDNALGIASNQGPGFGGYTDDVFNDFLWDTILSDFTYDSYEGIYDGSGGTDAQGISAINSGVSLINYTGHGSISSWGNGASLSTSQINSLTNQNKLPFVITVGCNVGEFNSTDESFAESWQRATHNGEPSGGIAHFGSTISQSWEPPMHGQYGMNLIITESLDEGVSRSLGGIATNGCMYMNDVQGSSGINETNYWTFFGDPSAVIRTDQPTFLSPNHDDVVIVGQEEFVVDIGFNGALAALSKDGELIGSAYSSGGVAVIELGDNADDPGQLDLVITSFNKFPYEAEVTVLTPNGAFVTVNDVNIDYGSDNVITPGESVNINITLENMGNEISSDVNVNLYEIIDNPYISIVNGSESINDLLNGSLASFDLSFNVSSSAPMGHSFALELELESEENSSSLTLNMTVQAMIESFENNGFASQNWEFGGDMDWGIDSGNSSNGIFSAKSGTIDHNMTSELTLTMEILQDGYITFDKKVSCEAVGESSGIFYDYLAFYIDGIEQNKWAGEIAWSQSNFGVSVGEHTFKWLFSKDLAVVAGEDAAWIDNIEFPPCVGSEGVLLGDSNYDGVLNVLDIVLVVNMILGISEPDMYSADVNQDGAVNVLDIVGIVNIILDSRGENATKGTLYNKNGSISISADGIIDAIQLKVKHDENIVIQLTEYSLLSAMNTIGNQTTIIIVAPESDAILEADGEIEILEIIAANSYGEIQLTIPEDFAIVSAYPNPFNPSTSLSYTIPENGYLRISIYDLTGRLVESLYGDYAAAGQHTINWNADMYSSGVYLAQFKYKNTLKTQKLMLMK
ncbi:MAG: T9SS type A sorting domain-containing protein [Candidatus Marinimicrobia bacterium]|nr:T9SS type A sorting domain-containing protein [Candidatus Neomarinimicrobiota bacterium]